jgi:chorismate lyase/3-hydroxybenzoate synthase
MSTRLVTRGGGALSRLSAVAPRIEYLPLEPGRPLPANALFAVEFGHRQTAVPPRCARVCLEPLAGAGLTEVWYANGPVHTGFDGQIRFAADDHHLAAAIEVDEREHGGLEAASAYVYSCIARFQLTSRYPHLLRIWNYLDDINQGDGDAERYRVFCTGRTTGLRELRQERFPAATAIGRRDGSHMLQVYWLAGRDPGIALENPRQLAAYQYPRQYGPTPPAFSRAMVVAPDLLMISGTASIVGHASRHAGSVQRQMAEILNNLDTLLLRARGHGPALPARFSRATLIKAYLRHPGDLPFVEQQLRERLPAGTPFLVLLGDVCRADLLLELDCLHAAE